MGDAGSLTPRHSATRTRCMRTREWTDTLVKHNARTTTTTSRRQFCSRVTDSFRLPSCTWTQLLTSMEVDGTTGAAARRRQRRVRAWLRHERQCPREKVVERRERQEGEVHETHNAPRSQTTPLPGKRPAPLSEVAGPQVAVTSGYVAASVHLLGAPVVGRFLGRGHRWQHPLLPPTARPGCQEEGRGGGCGGGGAG